MLWPHLGSPTSTCRPRPKSSGGRCIAELFSDLPGRVRHMAPMLPSWEWAAPHANPLPRPGEGAFPPGAMVRIAPSPRRWRSVAAPAPNRRLASIRSAKRRETRMSPSPDRALSASGPGRADIRCNTGQARGGRLTTTSVDVAAPCMPRSFDTARALLSALVCYATPSASSVVMPRPSRSPARD
jgi:hypothetical protein